MATKEVRICDRTGRPDAQRVEIVVAVEGKPGDRFAADLCGLAIEGLLKAIEKRLAPPVRRAKQ